MAVLGTTTKAAIGVKAAKNPIARGAAAKTVKAAPPAAKAGLKAAKPVIKRRTRKRLDDATDSLALTLATYAPRAARQLGLKPPRRKRTTPRVLAGVAIGAAGMYLLEPERGPKRREQLLSHLGR